MIYIGLESEASIKRTVKAWAASRQEAMPLSAELMLTLGQPGFRWIMSRYGTVHESQIAYALIDVFLAFVATQMDRLPPEGRGEVVDAMTDHITRELANFFKQVDEDR
jgi:hypothetical protein